jgi:all-trans-retinol dehydrogenase (NAD+)
MIDRKKGHILTMASMASYATVAGLVDYCATKAAVLSLHEGLHQELKHRYDAPEIKTSAVHPIYVNTTLIGSFRDSLAKTHSKLLDPQMVADAVVSQILSGKSGQVYLPKQMTIAAMIRALPWWVQELGRDGTAKHCLAEEAA